MNSTQKRSNAHQKAAQKIMKDIRRCSFHKQTR